MLFYGEPPGRHVSGMALSSRMTYSVDARAFEGGLEGTSMTRAVMTRSLDRIVISSPGWTSLALLAATPFNMIAPLSHSFWANGRRGTRRLTLRNTSMRKGFLFDLIPIWQQRRLACWLAKSGSPA